MGKGKGGRGMSLVVSNAVVVLFVYGGLICVGDG